MGGQSESYRKHSLTFCQIIDLKLSQNTECKVKHQSSAAKGYSKYEVSVKYWGLNKTTPFAELPWKGD